MKHIALSLFLLLLSFALHAQSKKNTISSLKLLGQYEIPFNKNFKKTTVGGLSGIDYDAKNKRYYLISDDRSAKNEARFYTAKIHLTEKGIDSVELLDVKTLLQPDGKPYPSMKQNSKLTPDPESIRYNPANNELVWANEGERTLNSNDTVLQNPSIQAITLDGVYKNSFTLPTILEMQKKEIGPRQNGTLEGLAFNEDYTTLFACLEEPLFQDGPKAEVTDTKSYVRILKFYVKSRASSAQFAYRLEPVAYPATPVDAFKVNGVSEIVSINENELLVVERSFSTGRLPCTIRLYLTDLSKAENVVLNPSLTKKPPIKIATKKMLLNMDDLNIFIDNIEGITFGPTLPNGHKTLIFVADNNFQPFEKNQFLLFEVMP